MVLTCSDQHVFLRCAWSSMLMILLHLSKLVLTGGQWGKVLSAEGMAPAPTSSCSPASHMNPRMAVCSLNERLQTDRLISESLKRKLPAN